MYTQAERPGMSVKHFIAFAFLLLTPPLLAQPLPTIASVSPDVILPGVVTDVTITGDNLSGATQIIVPGNPDGLAATFAAAPATGPASKKQLKLRIDAKAGVRRGQHELRLITPTGVSRTFSVGVDDLPIIEQKPGNTAAARAQVVKLPAIISGKLSAALEVNFYRFHAAKDERLMFDVFGQRIGSKLDSSLSLLDADGRLLGHDEDTNGLDSFIEFTAPADGEYLLRIQDLKYQGGDGFTYRIRAGAFPYLDAIFPMGGRRGETTAVHLIGRNLAGADKIQINADAAGPTGMRDVAATTGSGVSNARLFEVSDLPEFIEQEPNDSPTEANVVQAPVTINGQINKPGDVDRFKFKPTTQPLVCEVLAQRANSPLDALITLSDSEGRLVQRNNGDAGADARIEASNLTLGKEYTLSITDLLGRGGDAYVYRIAIKPAGAAEDFQVAFQGDAPRLARGGRAKLWCNVTRTGGYKGDITILLTGLPRGVRSEPLVLKDKEPSSGVFALSADADAPLGFYPIALSAVAQVNGQAVTRTFGKRGAGAGQIYLTVLDAPPFLVQQVGPNAQETDPKKRDEQIAELKKVLDTQTPELDTAQAQWEKAQAKTSWQPLKVISAKAKETQLKPQPDGTIKAEGAPPARDIYTVVTATTLKNIRAIKLEAIAADGNGPGRAEDGNFVLTAFRVQAALESDPAHLMKVELQNPRADFNQEGYNVKESLVEGTKAGWAVSPRRRESHWAIWETKTPIAADASNAAHLRTCARL